MMRRDVELALQPTDRPGPWHDFSSEELAPEARYSRGVLTTYPFSIERLFALPRTSAGAIDASAYLRRAWRGAVVFSPEEGLFWASLGLSSQVAYEGWVTEADLRARPLFDTTWSAEEVVSAIVAHGNDWTILWALQLATYWNYVGVLRATVDEPKIDTTAVLIELGTPPAAIADEIAAFVDEYVELTTVPITPLCYLADTYRTPKLIRLAAAGTTDDGLLDLRPAWWATRDPATFRSVAERMRDEKLRPDPVSIAAWVANFGTSDLTGMFELIVRSEPREYDSEVYREAFRVRDPEWVEHLYMLSDRSAAQPIVEHYLQNEGINAIEGLLRMSKRKGKRQLWAIDWLTRLAEDPAHRARLGRVAAQHPDAPDEVGKLLNEAAGEPARAFDGADLPARFDANLLPAARLVGGGVMAGEALAAAFVAPGDLRKRLANLDELLGSVIDRKWYADADAGHLRMLIARHLTDDLALRLALSVVGLSGWKPRGVDDNRTRAFEFVSTLDHPAARWSLLRGTEAQRHWVRNTTEAAIASVCATRGWDARQFADHAVPTFGLDSLGERTFDYGARRIRILISGRNDVVFTDGDREFTRLPNLRKGDDPLKVRNHQEDWKRINTLLREEFARQADRFERAMATRRRWSADALNRDLLSHPILGQIARRVIWTRDHDGETQCLLSPDGDAFDVAYGHVARDVGTWRVTHPTELDSGAWIEVLAESAVIQPFEQAGRPPTELLAAGSEVLAYRFAEHAWPEVELVPHDGSRFYCDVQLADEDGRAVTLRLEPGVRRTSLGRFSPQQEPVQDFVGLHWSDVPVAALKDEAARLLKLCAKR